MAKSKYTAIGGQALIEGIMMKSPEKTALAVRKPDKTIDISYIEEKSIRSKYKFLGLPVIRGVVVYIESMIQGYKTMMKSAEISGFTDFDEEPKKQEINEPETGNNPEESNTEAEKALGEALKENKEEKKESPLITAIMIIGTVLGCLLAVVLFMYIPSLITDGIKKLFGIENMSAVVDNLIQQFIKLVVFVVYIWAVSFMKDIRRVFMYHGAEHKTIFCYEKGLPLTVENVRRQIRFHPRCGTSFLILMILVSVVFSSIVQAIFPGVREIRALWVVIKILLVPLVCGAGYEILKLCGKYDNVFTKIVSAPGLWVQRLTTKEPMDDMIEIAIAALKACEPAVPDVERPIEENEPADTEITAEESEAQI